MSLSLFQRYTDDLVVDAVLSGTAPLTTYALTTLQLNQPSARVLWGAGTVTIHIVPNGSKIADILVIPVCNMAGGTITLTSSTGMSVSIPLPTILAHGMSATLAVDLRLLDSNDAHRTSSGNFELVFTSPSSPLILGGALILYGPARPLTNSGYQWGVKETPTGYRSLEYSEHGIEYLTSRRTIGRSFDLQLFTDNTDRAVISEWSNASFAGSRPCFTWVSPSVSEVNLPLYGLINQIAFTDNYKKAIGVSVTFGEFNKGKPIA